MPISVIPFNMPEPAEIPSHIIDSLRSMAADEAVIKSMELLMQVEAANVIVYERLIDSGSELRGVVGEKSAILQSILESADGTLTDLATEHKSPLLIMGQVVLDDIDPFPEGVTGFLLNGEESGSVGFNYILPFQSQDGRILGTLTLFRSANDGPLNHEQPNICEAIRVELTGILA
ncbi:MAG: hypothetical protein VX294_14465 [Candidatus Latescibacterota bacterium]|nr:hypothetical protein [Candidatus Latescibacterota bacterium]